MITLWVLARWRSFLLYPRSTAAMACVLSTSATGDTGRPRKADIMLWIVMPSVRIPMDKATVSASQVDEAVLPCVLIAHKMRQNLPDSSQKASTKTPLVSREVSPPPPPHLSPNLSTF